MINFVQPLEQFEIVVLKPIILFNSIDFSFTNASLYLILATSLFLSLFYFATYYSRIVPQRWQLVTESFYEFLLDMLNQQVGVKGHKYFPVIFVTFSFIFMINILGMVPYSFTVGSHIIQTFTLSGAFWIALTILGFVYQKMHFFNLFLPKGVPSFILPALFVIELITYTSRAFSLAIRLFANLMSGHTLLNILSSFALSLWKKKVILGLIPFIIVFFVSILEFGIAFLQAYVFTVLLCIYLHDSIHGHE